MEPTLDHSGLEILGVDECLELLDSQPIGRVAYIEAGSPVVLPVNYRLEGRHIVFRTTHGEKLSTALMNRPVAFEVDNYVEGQRTGWSVLVRGRAEVEFAPSDGTPASSEVPDAWADRIERAWLVRIRSEEITGRRIPPVRQL